MRTLTHSDDIKLLSLLADASTTTDAHAVPCLLPNSPTSWRQCRNIAAVCLLMDTGLRIGELSKLLYTDIFFNDQPVKMLHISAWVGKRGRQRDIPLAERTRSALARYNAKPRLIRDYPITGPAFPTTPLGRTLTPRQWQRILNKAGRLSIGLEVHPHMLRHTFATRLLQVTDIRTVQELLGHENLSSTQIYTHTTDDQKRMAITAAAAAASSPLGDVPAPQLPSDLQERRPTFGANR